MKSFISLCIITSLLLLHTSNCYILLTANMEDVQSLAKQLASSPVVDEVSKMWRRATEKFQRGISGDPRRRGEESDDDSEESDPELEQRTRRVVRDLIALGRSSGILGPIKRAYDLFVNNS